MLTEKKINEKESICRYEKHTCISLSHSYSNTSKEYIRLCF